MKYIPLTGKYGFGKYAIVDDEDYEVLKKHSWRLTRHGYVIRSTKENKKSVHFQMHRVILNARKNQQIDHKNRIRFDNRKTNLRFCSSAQNRANSRKRNNRTSKYKGVSWNTERGKWVTQICYNRQTIFIGRFDSERHAALVYDLWAKDIFGEYACTNFQ
jgi:hypothetical protein